MHLYAHVNSIEDGVGLLLVHLVGLLDHLVLVSYLNRYKLHFYHTKNLPLWTKPTPNTLASYWASLSLFIFSSSVLTHPFLVSALPAPAPTWAIHSLKQKCVIST